MPDMGLMGWVDELSPGSVVAVESGYGNTAYTLREVVRLTPTQVILPNDMRYRRDNGNRVGSGDRYRTDRIVPATDEVRATVRAATLAARLSEVRWRALPLEVLERIYAAVPS
jgi:hypothetical protein